MLEIIHKNFHDSFGTTRRYSVAVQTSLKNLGITDTSVLGINMLQLGELIMKRLIALLKSEDFVPTIILM